MHPDADNTYRMGYYVEFPNGDNQTYPASPAGWDNYILDNYAGVTNITSFIFQGMPTSIQDRDVDKVVLTEDIIWAEPNFGEVVFMDIIKGNKDLVLAESNSIVLSESAAYELFGNEEPINKIVSVTHTWTTRGERLDLIVSGVMRDMPSNSHLRPKYIANVHALSRFDENMENAIDSYMGDLNTPGMWTQSLFVCNNEAELALLTEDIQNKANKIIETAQIDIVFKPLIKKITDVHFDQEIDWAVSHKATNRQYMFVFITVALLILVIACINYMNLATARSARRAKEVGLRKTLGSTRRQLFGQFILESFILVIISTILSLILVLIFLPQFNDLAAKSFTYQHLINTNMLMILLGVILFVTLVAGSYPALYISGFQPATVLKGSFSYGKGANFFRKFLTTVQFSISVVLLISTIFVVRQMNMMRYSKLNEAGNQVVSIRYGGFTGNASNSKYNTYKNILKSNPDIGFVTLANHLPRLDYFGGIGYQFQFPEVSDENYDWNQLSGDFDFPSTFKMNIVAGRTFDSENVSDSSSVLINEAGLKSLGITAEEAINLAIKTPIFDPDSGALVYDHALEGHIIGVVEDFPYQSMYNEIEPLVISPRPDEVDRIIHVSIPSKDMGKHIAFIEDKWKELFPEFGFDYWFVNDEFARMYENETQISALTEKFSILAILITCVGLYGMASFTASQRTKEIGVRKVLGANVSQITGLLLNVFLKLLAVSSTIGVPFAYFVSNKWLSNFVYKTPLSPAVFIGAVLLISAVTLITVSYETIKAARTNPITALRYNN
jgi:putative ABC transport system permease protein